jgi:uncharacterized tellurite resistance protein B-like protein
VNILRFLGLEERAVSAPAAETDTIRKIADALDHLEPERAKFIAGFAYLLGRVARADMKISPEETRAMERLVVERGGLPEEQAIIVVQMAKTQNVLFGSTENFLVTREFGRIATREQKVALLECLFAVSAADDSVSVAEDNEISQIANELRLEHPDVIAARSRYREYLAVLKKPPTDAVPRTQN